MTSYYAQIPTHNQLVSFVGVEERISDGPAVISPTNVEVSGSCGRGSGVTLPGFSGSTSPSTLGALLNTSTSSSTSSLILPWNGHSTNTNHHNISPPPSEEAATLVALAVNNSTNSFGSGSSPSSGKGGSGNKHGHNSRGDSCTHTNGEHHDTTCITANLGDSANLRHRGSKGSSQVILNGLSNSGITHFAGNGNSVANGSASHGSTIGEVDYMEKMKEEASGHHSDHSSKSSNGILPGSNNITTANANTNTNVGGSNKPSKPSSGGGSGSTPRDASRKNRGDGASSGKQGSTKEVDPTAKMEGDLKKLKIDLQISRNKENELRDQIISYMSSK